MIVITKFFLRSELKPLKNQLNLKDVFEGAKRIDKNLGISIKNPVKFSNLRFFKIRLGRSVKERMIVFLYVGKGKIVPLLLRLKKDKEFGVNMSMNNKKIIELLRINFENVIKDLENGDFEEFDL
jgi:hypothetical protein